ncbi:hypothetical protein lerEdw1_008282 [Lerista edwardsae]|nr:hypothetical protein lerEdw1_008282 [Lerista edwardsae]
MLPIIYSAVMLLTLIHKEIREKIGSFIWEQITDPLDLQSSPLVKEKCNREEEELEDKTELDRSKDHQMPGMLKNRKQAYIPLRDYPASNMVIGYASAKEMKKFTGKIHDFVPGCSGYLAYWIQKETNVFSDLKTKLKRKL